MYFLGHHFAATSWKKAPFKDTDVKFTVPDGLAQGAIHFIPRVE